MRKTALAGLFAISIFSIASSSSVSAQTPDNTLISKDIIAVSLPAAAMQKVVDINVPAPVAAPAAPSPAELEKYTVSAQDTLSSIALAHNTTWKRLYDNNTFIVNPDVITEGQEIIIPKPDETLTERPLPEPVVEETPVNAKPFQAPASTPAPAFHWSVSGNRYTPGYCTWYAKNRRPDLPNNLGDATTWVSRAAAQGLATGSAPRSGAIGQSGGHVVYVENVNGDGTVTISEMNHAGLYVITTRTLPASYFSYIY